MAYTLKDLRPFCGLEDVRSELKEPWLYKGHTYASDGRVCIRVVGLVVGAVTWSDRTRTLARQIDVFLKADKELEFSAIPELPPPIFTDCAHCKKGKCKREGCCGFGCVGSICDYCDGTGKRRLDTAVKIGKSVFNPFYLGKLKTINALIAPRKAEEFAVFKAPRCLGAIMPMRYTAAGKSVFSPNISYA